MATEHICTRYDEAGKYLGWCGEHHASAKSAKEHADELNANLESGDYLWAADTEAAVTAYRDAYGEDGPPAEGEDGGDAEVTEDVEEPAEDAPDDEATEDAADE